MINLRQLFFFPIDDIRRWDFRVALILLFSVPFFYIYAFFPDFINFFLKKESPVEDNSFFYHFFSKFLLVVLLSLWWITSRRWWWYFISWPLLMNSEDFFSIILKESGYLKNYYNDFSGFNTMIGSFILFPLYFLRINYQAAFIAFNKKKDQMLRYEKRDILLDNIAIWILCFSLPISFIFLFFPYNDNFIRLGNFYFELSSKSGSSYFIYHFFDKLVIIMVFFVWFFSSTRWWYFLIAWPILFYVFTLAGLFRDSLRIFSINPRWVYIISFMVLNVYPLYKIRKYLQWDVFHDQFKNEKGSNLFWKKITYILNSMGEYFIILSSLILINIFAPRDILYPLNFITFFFLSIWFLFCRQWWYFLISIPVLWYGIEVISVINNEAIILLFIALLASYPLYRMRRYFYKEVIKIKKESEDEKEEEYDKTNKFSRCILKEEFD